MRSADQCNVANGVVPFEGRCTVATVRIELISTHLGNDDGNETKKKYKYQFQYCMGDTPSTFENKEFHGGTTGRTGGTFKMKPHLIVKAAVANLLLFTTLDSILLA